jgi:hypothetical protein
MKATSLLEYGRPLLVNDVPTPTIACDEILEVRRGNYVLQHINLAAS